MKEELEKLGFEYDYISHDYWLKINHISICVDINNNRVYMTGKYIFPYNHEKLKQLIKLLS